MRIHRLDIQAFGPFAGAESIGFDELGAAGLFLLNGETGAGKTSVLDAICFALYGGLPGARKGTRSIRSSHADDGVAPETVLEFSVRERRFEVTRSPAWDRPKLRGTGTTVQKAQARLRERVDGEWRVKSTRNDEVGAEIAAIIGMNLDQFTRVAMLPQGEFARFLRADDAERHDLLESLFDVGEYKAVEARLAERRRSLAAQARDAAAEREHLVESILSDAAAYAPAPEEAPADDAEDAETADGGTAAPATDAAASGDEAGEAAGDEDAAVSEGPRDVTALLAGIEAEIERRTLDAGRAVQAAATRRRQARTALEQIRQRRSDAVELARWEEARARHASGEEDVGRQRRDLDADARARRVLEVAARHQRAADAVAQGRALVAQARSDAENDALSAGFLAEAGESAETASPGAALGAAEEARTLAESLVPLEREQAERQGRLVETREKIATLDAGITAAQGRIDAAARQMAESRARITEHTEAAEALPAAETALREADERLEAARARDAYAEEHTRITRDWSARAREHAAAVTRHADLVSARLGQSAIALAAELEPGQPCAVCGGTEHPAPARPAEGDAVVTDQQIDEAQQHAEDLGRRAAAAAEARATADAHQDQLEQRAGGTETATALADRESAHEHQQAAATAAAAVTAARRELDDAAEVEKAGHQQLAAAREDHARLTAGAEQQQTQLDDAARRLREAAAGAGSLSARVGQLREAVDLLERLRRASEAVPGLEQHERDCDAELAASRDSEGFDTLDDARAARLDDTARAAAERTVREHEREATRLATVAESEPVRRAVADRAAERPVPGAEDEEAACAADEQAEQAHTDEVSFQGGLESHARRFANQRERLQGLEARTGPLVEEYELVKSLADTVTGSGENRYRMTLSTYVLAARLEAVAAAANERLLTMTDGRFTLAHDDASAGRGKGGLGLRVADGWMGHERETGSLSGGESFMASLALALGLADVIQAESGGIDMETLFVDEGFGSLDPVALERVMNALDGLRASGRIVGIVSHVNDLKEQIAAQLVVHKTRDGSTTTLELDTCGA